MRSPLSAWWPFFWLDQLRRLQMRNLKQNRRPSPMLWSLLRLPTLHLWLPVPDTTVLHWLLRQLLTQPTHRPMLPIRRCIPLIMDTFRPTMCSFNKCKIKNIFPNYYISKRIYISLFGFIWGIFMWKQRKGIVFINLVRDISLIFTFINNICERC